MKRKALIAARIALGLSQETVAKQIDVSQWVLTKWEAGQAVPDPISRKKLCNLYDQTPESLVLDITGIAMTRHESLLALPTSILTLGELM